MIYTYEDALAQSTEYFNGDALAAEVFLGKYALRNNDGDLVEANPKHMHQRLAKEFARIEKKYPNSMSEEEIFDLFDGFKRVIAQGSPMSAVGNEYKTQSTSNCFVLESPHDSYGGILKTDQELVQVAKRRGGIGFDISNIRPKGLPTSNAAGTTDGIGIFMERFSNSCREVAQKGRRGALLLSIDCHHPEIETFINIKKDLKKVTGANISIRWSDEFLSAVEKGEQVQLRWPVSDKETPEISQMVNAKDIWDKFTEASWASAEPGCLFWDTAIARTPSDIYSDEGFGSTSTNPSLAPDTKVLTKNGVRSIKWLAENEPLTFVRNIKGEWVPGEVLQTGRDKNLVKITFSNNSFAVCTPEHKWPVFNTSGNLFNAQTGRVVKKYAPDLKRKDKIYFPSFDRPIDNPSCKFTKEDGFVLGWNLGDGWRTYHKTQKTIQYGFEFGLEDVKSGIGQRVLNYTNKLAARPSSLRNDHDCKAKTYVTTDKNVCAQFANMKACHKKEGIPQSIWEGNHEFVSGFIDGLFSADGSVFLGTEKAHNHEDIELSDTYVVLISAYENLIQDVRDLLSFYGIRSNLNIRQTESSFPNGSSGTHTRCELKIAGMDALKFSQTFKLSSKNKQARLEAIKSANNSMYKNKRDYLVVKEVSTLDSKSDVYDIKVLDETNTFQINVGITGNCGEIILSPNDSCRLLLLNTFSFVKNPFTPEAYYDYSEFAEYVYKAQRLMDDLIDLELEAIERIIKKIKQDPEPDEIKRIELDLWTNVKRAAEMGRRTGLGVNAIGDTLAALNVVYGSDESVAIVENIYKNLALSAYRSSCILAQERGSFSVYDFKKEQGHPFIEQLFKADPTLRELHQAYGRRNIALTTTAPSGSVSILTQTTSGIEPVFMTSYKRRKKINPDDENTRVDFTDQMGDSWQEFEVYHHGVRTWMEITGKTDVKESPYANATANEIDWEGGVRVQAAAQKWVCHAISRTTNLPNSATMEDINNVFWTGWKSGCKGITVYRDGCRSGVLVSESDDGSGRPNQIVNTQAPKRPELLPCEIFQAQVKGVKWTILVGMLYDQPYEIFVGHSDDLSIPAKYTYGHIKKIKSGNYDLLVDVGDDEYLVIKNIIRTFANPESSWATRIISVALRHGAPIDFLVEQLGKEGTMFDVNKVIARLLKKYIKDGHKVRSSQICESCSSTNLIYEEGCVKCLDCGVGKCG